MSFTPEEEEQIERLVVQFSVNESLPQEGVVVNLNAPPLFITFPPSPPSPTGVNGSAQAATRHEAFAIIDSQVDAALDAAKAAIDAWIAGLSNHHRDFEVYREAYRRAKARL
jgi:hypothetical protein